ncbi:MAG: ferredoxin family protein [Proteobacteria bacterium]|nr:ferredoxin family protein [Pseudomonadota bacterium]
MTFVIANACIDVMDKSCIEVCPVDCIFIEDDDRMCYIEPNDCIDCGVCESACPVGAIFEGSAVPHESAVFTEINALWFEDKDAARAKIDSFLESSPSIS